jgi:hypothetical protein
MTRYLAGVLTVIAAGVLLIAYGLLVPRPAALAMTTDGYGSVQRVPVAQYTDTPQYIAYQPATTEAGVRAVRTSQYVDPPAMVRTAPPTIVRRAPRRDWVRTALIIGGSSAAGAGVGGLIGGKKGALIGAAIGGGASALIQTR